MDTARRLAARLRPPTLAYSDAAALRPAAERTRTLRVALFVALIGLVVVAAVLAPRAKGRAAEQVAPKTSGVLVIDVSRSIIDSEFDRIGTVLAQYAKQNGHVGLVLFSDVPYEVLPPGSPTSAIVPILHFFTPVKGRLPPNPWDATFRAGTRISAAPPGPASGSLSLCSEGSCYWGWRQTSAGVRAFRCRAPTRCRREHAGPPRPRRSLPGRRGRAGPARDRHPPLAGRYELGRRP